MMGGIISEGDPAGPPSAELLAAWVEPSHRGTGVAMALVKAIAEWAIDQCAMILRAWVMEDNARAVGFYRKAGLQATGQNKTFGTNSPRTALLMVKTLAVEE